MLDSHRTGSAAWFGAIRHRLASGRRDNIWVRPTGEQPARGKESALMQSTTQHETSLTPVAHRHAMVSKRLSMKMMVQQVCGTILAVERRSHVEPPTTYRHFKLDSKHLQPLLKNF